MEDFNMHISFICARARIHNTIHTCTFTRTKYINSCLKKFCHENKVFLFKYEK